MTVLKVRHATRQSTQSGLAHYYVLIIFLSNNQDISRLILLSVSAQPSVKSSSKLTAPLMSLGAGEEGEGREEGGR